MSQDLLAVRQRPMTHRSLAPDLARGFMLLVIAVVHAYGFRPGATGGLGLAGPGDQIATAVVALFAENRGYPMFAALFGYGLAQIYRRRMDEGVGWTSIRRFVRRRGWWLIVIGLAHTALLFYGDVIAVYGTIALLFVAVLRVTDRTLLTTAVCCLVPGSVAYAVISTAFFSAAENQAVTDPWLDAVIRVMIMPLFIPLIMIISVFPFLVGIWAARRRLLEDPAKHRLLLRRIAGGGLLISVLGAVAHTLVQLQVWQPGEILTTAAFWLHLVTGYAGAFAYASIIALIADRAQARRGPVITALAATGQRSMTSYLLQSVVWAALIPPYALDVAPRLTEVQAVGLGVAVWLATVLLSELQRRAGFKQGPAEWFLRRMSYGARPARR